MGTELRLQLRTNIDQAPEQHPLTVDRPPCKRRQRPRHSHDRLNARPKHLPHRQQRVACTVQIAGSGSRQWWPIRRRRLGRSRRAKQLANQPKTCPSPTNPRGSRFWLPQFRPSARQQRGTPTGRGRWHDQPQAGPPHPSAKPSTRTSTSHHPAHWARQALRSPVEQGLRVGPRLRVSSTTSRMAPVLRSA